MDNNNIPQNGNERMPESAIPPLPEYEEGISAEDEELIASIEAQLKGL